MRHLSVAERLAAIRDPATRAALVAEATLVNGQMFMRDGEHTGALAGRTLRSTD